MEQMTYRNAQLTVTGGNGSPQMEIDGAAVEVSRDPESGVFSSAELPYRTFESVQQLGKAIIDQRRGSAGAA